jgi:hypothetical protein
MESNEVTPEDMKSALASGYIVIDLATGNLVRVNDPRPLFVYQAGATSDQDVMVPLTESAKQYAEARIKEFQDESK